MRPAYRCGVARLRCWGGVVPHLQVGKIIAAMKTAFVLLVVALTIVHAAAQTPPSRQAPTATLETYESVDIDANGNLRILTPDQRTIIVPKGGSPKTGESFGKQTAFENPVLSDDRRCRGASYVRKLLRVARHSP